MSNSEPEWKDVVGYEDILMVSNKGDIWSKRSNRVMKPNLHEKGYLLISTKIGGRKGKNKTFRIHRLVAEAFITPIVGKDQVNHKDGNKQNNCVDNLEWVTGSENVRHAFETGLSSVKKGFESGRTALTKENVDYIKSVYKPRCKEFGARALGKKFGVPHSTIIRSVGFL